MSQKPHVYQWEDEPADQRPSEFASTSFALTSGYSSMYASRRRPARRAGFRTLIVVTILLVGLGGWLLHHFAHLVGHG
jgi:hypothetical protein